MSLFRHWDVVAMRDTKSQGAYARVDAWVEKTGAYRGNMGGILGTGHCHTEYMIDELAVP